MTSLYAISAEYQQFFSSLDDDEINQEQLSKISSYETKIEDKSIAIACVIKNIEAEYSAVDDAIKSMSNRKRSLDNKIEYLKNYLKTNMQNCGINEISSSPYFKIKLKKCPLSVNIIDESKIGGEYKKIKEVVSIDKVKLKEDLKEGVFVEGAELNQNLTLEIK